MEILDYPRWLYTKNSAFIVQDAEEHALHPDASLTPIDQNAESETKQDDAVQTAEPAKRGRPAKAK